MIEDGHLDKRVNPLKVGQYFCPDCILKRYQVEQDLSVTTV